MDKGIPVEILDPETSWEGYPPRSPQERWGDYCPPPTKWRPSVRKAVEQSVRDNKVLADEPVLQFVVNTQLPTVPDPLRLRHGPLLVTIEMWSDGIVVARLPAAALYGEGDNDTAALDALVTAAVEFIDDVSALLKQGKIKGGLLKQWKALTELIDISGLQQVDD